MIFFKSEIINKVKITNSLYHKIGLPNTKWLGDVWGSGWDAKSKLTSEVQICPEMENETAQFKIMEPEDRAENGKESLHDTQVIGKVNFN